MRWKRSQFEKESKVLTMKRAQEGTRLLTWLTFSSAYHSESCIGNGFQHRQYCSCERGCFRRTLNHDARHGLLSGGEQQFSPGTNPHRVKKKTLSGAQTAEESQAACSNKPICHGLFKWEQLRTTEASTNLYNF